ncbi:uncharacterized protein LOC134863300 isoform X2 [Eleginops maclovinus]
MCDSILPLLLDFIYTGDLPYSHSKHQYQKLLTAACYLQMDGLQEALMARQQTDAEARDNANVSTGTFIKYLLLSLETEVHPYSANVDTCNDIDPCRSSSKNGTNHFSRTNTSSLRAVNTCHSISESTESSVNTGNYRQEPQDLIQNIPCTLEVLWESGDDREVQKDQFHSGHSAGSVKTKPWQGSTDGELERTVEERRRSNKPCTSEVQEEETSRKEKKQGSFLTLPSQAEDTQTNRKEVTTQIRHSLPLHFSTSHLKDSVSPSQCSSSSSSSPPPQCCGCVPVICHSSRVAMLQLKEVAPMPPYHLVSQASVSSSRTPYSRSGRTDSDNIVEGITNTHGNLYGAQNQAYINNKDHIGSQSWDYKGISDQSDTLKQDYNISNTYNLIRQDSEQMSITDSTDHHAHRGSIKNQYIKRLRDDSRNKDYSNFARGLNYSIEDFPSKHQRIDCQNVWMANAAEEQSIQSQDLRDKVLLPVQDSDPGSDFLFEHHCAQEEVKEEQSQEERESVNRDTARRDKRYNVRQLVSPTHQPCLDGVTGDLSGSDCPTSAEPDNIPGSDIKEQPFTFTKRAAHMSDTTYSVVAPSYRGHLQYHCLPEEETHSAHQYSGRKRSHHPDHSYPSSDEEESGTFASQGYSSLRQHFATGTTDQILLLDISTKPAEFLFANSSRQKETFGNGFRKNTRDKLSEATSVAGVDSKYWVGETNVKESKSVGKDQSRPRIEVIHPSAVEKRVSTHKDGDKKTPALTICSPPNVQDSVQASMSSILSGCIPSFRSTSMPTTISARVSNPVHHPFQCSMCDRSFSQRGSLNRHVRSHLGVRPFPCPRCPMTFSRQYRVTEHMRVHQRCVILSDFRRHPAS